MKAPSTWLAALLLALTAPAALAGRQLTEIELADFAQTKAKSFADYSGRTVLLEFFAFW